MLSFKDIGVTTLTFWGQVTSSLTWPQWTPNMWFPIGSQYEPTIYLARMLRYWASKILGSQPWPLWSRVVVCDVTIGLPVCMGFPTRGQFEPTVYLARFSVDIKPQWHWSHDRDISWSRDVIGHVTIGLAMCSFLLVVNMNRPCISHGCWDIELQKYWGHDLDLLGSRYDVTSSVTWPLDSWYAVSYRWFFETIALSRIVVEILCVKHLAKHIPTENALILIFVF